MLNPYTKATFLKSAAQVKQLPEDSGYEVAFAGRSNAGKSSAINYLTNNKQLARTSKTPGRTRLINLFTIGDETRRIVDLPGYGYAKVAIKVKEDWQKNLAQYLEVRKSLKGLVLMMDIRHPLKELDKWMINWALTGSLPIHILLTKSDKLTNAQANSELLQVKNYYKNISQDLLSIQTFSATKRKGIEELIGVLNKWLNW